MPIEPGKYKTISGDDAEVLSVKGCRAIGWVKTQYDEFAAFWVSETGACSHPGDFGFDLDLRPATIKILGAELPKPEQIYRPSINTFVYNVHMTVRLKNQEAAEQWAAWWRKNVAKGGRDE